MILGTNTRLLKLNLSHSGLIVFVRCLLKECGRYILGERDSLSERVVTCKGESERERERKREGEREKELREGKR